MPSLPPKPLPIELQPDAEEQPLVDAPDASGALGAAQRQRPLSHYVAAGLTALLMLGVLGWLIFRERAALLSIDVAQAWPALLVGQLLMIGGLLAAAWVWAHIMRTMGSALSKVDHLHIYASTHLARHLPGTVWYVVGRSYFYGATGEPARVVAMGSAIELLVTTIAGAIVALSFMFLSAAQTQAASIVAMALVVVSGALVVQPARSTGLQGDCACSKRSACQRALLPSG